MFDELSVAENIFMGHMPLTFGGRVDWFKMRARARHMLKRLEADFDADALLKQLGVAQKHLVEIARALSHDANIIIMDEPTSALSAREIGDLFVIIEQLKKHNCAILFISHKFDEIFQVADRWTCLRDGEEVGPGAHRRHHAGRSRPPHGRSRDRSGLSQARRRNWARSCSKRTTFPTPPNSTGSRSSFTPAKSSASMASSARAVPRRCKACSASANSPAVRSRSKASRSTSSRPTTPFAPASPICQRIVKPRARCCRSASAPTSRSLRLAPMLETASSPTPRNWRRREHSARASRSKPRTGSRR